MIQNKVWNHNHIIVIVLITTDLIYACSFCSMLATRPLVSTRARIGLLKYNLLSKVFSPKSETGLGIRFRKRKAPSPTTAITTSTTAIVMPADPWEGSLSTRAVEAKHTQVLTVTLLHFETLYSIYLSSNILPIGCGFSVGVITEKKNKYSM